MVEPKVEPKVLMVCRDPVLTKTVKAALRSRSALGLRVVEQVDEITKAAEEQGVSLIVVHLDEWMGSRRVARLLWLSSILPRPVPVLVLSDHYDSEEARTMFQMGAADYVSRSDHFDKLASLILLLTLGSGTNAPEPGPNRPATWSRCTLSSLSTQAAN